MAINSSIEWTESTWNPVTGCTQVSPGCRHCYAERMTRRLCAMGQRNYKNGFQVTVHPHTLDIPSILRKPQMIFVNSMSDLFHEEVPLPFIQKVFEVMQDNPQHQYQVLTKRAKRLAEVFRCLPWPDNVWMGVSIENEKYLSRADCLRRTGAKIKFLSIEPILGPLPRLDLAGIDWVIVGGESGPGARPVEPSWVREIRDKCFEQKVPFFFKQWGGFNKKKNGRELDGKIWNQMPVLAAAY